MNSSCVPLASMTISRLIGAGNLHTTVAMQSKHTPPLTSQLSDYLLMTDMVSLSTMLTTLSV